MSTKKNGESVPRQEEIVSSTTGSAFSHAEEKPDFIAYPTNKVIGFIDDPSDAQAALRDLNAAGFTADEIEVLTGEEGARRIDVTGREHGLLARIVRSIQKLSNYESEHIKRHEQELLAGHFGIGVTPKRESDREQIAQILKSHNGHFINYYGEWAMQRLAP
jgi:hypothetical protein